VAMEEPRTTEWWRLRRRQWQALNEI